MSKNKQLREDIQFMINHQKWRRGDESLSSPDPKLLGECIDRIISSLNETLPESDIDKLFNELISDLREEEMNNLSGWEKLKIVFFLGIQSMRTVLASWIMPHQAFLYIDKGMNEYIDYLNDSVDNL